MFSLRKRWDNREAVEELMDIFGVGVIYECAARGATQKSAYYRVGREDELTIVVAHFERFPLVSPNKRAVFEAWSKMVEMKIGRPQHRLTPDYVAEMRRLANLITVRQCRPRGRKI